jgi:Ca2+/Na+ antiporter
VAIALASLVGSNVVNLTLLLGVAAAGSPRTDSAIGLCRGRQCRR